MLLPLIHVLATTSDGVPTRRADATLLGDEAGAWAGSTLANVGDVDGDGQVDVLVGAPYADERAGIAYLISGPVTGRVDLSDADARFVGASARHRAGLRVAGAGDVDADGYDDVIIGAPGYGQPGRPKNLGAAHLVLGPVTGSFDLSMSDATFVGPAPNDYAGWLVSGAGDMDGDGLPDLLVGAPGIVTPADGGDCCTGEAYMMSGTRRGSHGLRTADAWMQGETNDYLGNSGAGLGDVDGDGLDDFLIAAYLAQSDDGFDAGVSYVLFGPVDGRLDPSDADAMLVGESGEDNAGTSTASAGDVDADGLRDILIGAQHHDDDKGAAYLVHGGVTGTLLLSDADARLVGEAEGDWAGISVSGAGDVNADGHDDILVGAYWNDEGGTNAGAAYLVHGPVTSSLDLGHADLKLVGAEGDWVGTAVSGAGDLDGDGRADILVGAPEASPHGVRWGAAYVLYGNGL